MKKGHLKPNQKQILKDLRKQMDEVRAQCYVRQTQRLLLVGELASRYKLEQLNLDDLARAFERIALDYP